MLPKVCLPSRLADHKMENEFVDVLNECVQNGFNINSQGHHFQQNILLKQTTQGIKEHLLKRNDYILTKDILYNYFSIPLPASAISEQFQSLLINKYQFDPKEPDSNPLHWPMPSPNEKAMSFWIKEKPYFEHFLNSHTKCPTLELLLDSIFSLIGNNVSLWTKFLKNCGFFNNHNMYELKTLNQIYLKFETIAPPKIVDSTIDRIGASNILFLMDLKTACGSIKRYCKQTTQQMFDSLNLHTYKKRLTCFMKFHSLTIEELYLRVTNKSQKVLLCMYLIHSLPSSTIHNESELMDFQPESFQDLMFVCIANARSKAINYDFLMNQSEKLLDEMILNWNRECN